MIFMITITTILIMGSLFSAASAEVDHCLPQLLLAYAPVIVVVKHPDNQSFNQSKIQQINPPINCSIN